jgi:hypothetical protein
MTRFKHDVFISYASPDREWAERLAHDLEKRKISCFLDRRSLRAGDNWKETLLDALVQSQHLVVLWSRHAKESDWVINERTRFDMRPRAEGGEPERMIFVLLDDQPAAFNALQMIVDIRDSGSYAGGSAAIPIATWQRVLQKIENAIVDPEEFVLLRLAVITTTKAGLARIDFDAVPPGPGSESLNALLVRMGVARDQLSEYYGATRDAWKPFGGAGDSIGAILENVRTQLNQTSGGTKFRWDPVGDDLWSDNESIVEHAAARLASDAAVIVLDPLALYEPKVSYIFSNWLWRVFENEKALIMVLSLYPLPNQARTLREMVKQVNRRLIDLFYEDPPVRIPYAQCNVFTGDERDIIRLLRTQLRVYARVGRPASTPEVFKTETPKPVGRGL